jgi:hypothetical protein
VKVRHYFIQPKQKQLSPTGYSASSVICEEFQVQEGAASAGPPAENLLPTRLLLVAVRKGDVNVLEGEIVFGKLLQAQYIGIFRCVLNP